VSGLILTMHTSADGYVATEDGGIWPGFGWPRDAQNILNDLYRDVQALVFGRGVYEVMVPYWSAVARGELPEHAELHDIDLEFAQLFAAIPKLLVSRTNQPVEDGVEIVRDGVVDRVRALKEQADDGHVLLLAGGGLAGQVAAAGLLDELFLLVGTMVLGSGRPLLEVDEPLCTSLLSATPLPPTCTLIRYAVERRAQRESQPAD
jgi:dihydrofolate reductase